MKGRKADAGEPKELQEISVAVWRANLRGDTGEVITVYADYSGLSVLLAGKSNSECTRKLRLPLKKALHGQPRFCRDRKQTKKAILSSNRRSPSYFRSEVRVLSWHKTLLRCGSD